MCLFTVVAISLAACSKGKLGSHCDNINDCKTPLVCGTKDIKDLKIEDDGDKELAASFGHICLGPKTCRTSDDCAGLGDHPICLNLGTGTCMRGCAQDADCPAQTYCKNHTYCRE
jgi:hypothetical protein